MGLKCRLLHQSCSALASSQPDSGDDKDGKKQGNSDEDKERILSILKTLFGFFFVPIVVLSLLSSAQTGKGSKSEQPQRVIVSQ